ncbi:MAG: 50S ribosomal protein L10 [Clostridia bacterium]|jgi:large subunit ribosomal protein L10
MSANREAKKLVVADIKDKLSRAKGAVLVDYRGLTVQEATELRKQFREADIEYKVLKNTLIQLAAKELDLSEMDQFLTGPTAIAFGYNDPMVPAKILTEFIKKTKKMEVKGGLVEGKVIDTSGVEYLSSLPSREELIAKMLGSMNAPISGFVGVLSGTLRSLLYTLNAIKEQKGA